MSGFAGFYLKEALHCGFEYNYSLLEQMIRTQKHRKELCEKGKNPFEIVKFDNKDNTKDIKQDYKEPAEGEEAEPVEVTLAGRLMAKRGHGKASFCDLQDMYGRIQIYVKLDEVGEESYEEFKELFPNNHVEYFVSYYDYYQPEAYVPSKDLYIEKDSSINDEIDELRHAATAAIIDRRDTIIVSSVSCIYSIGEKEKQSHKSRKP